MRAAQNQAFGRDLEDRGRRERNGKRAASPFIVLFDICLEATRTLDDHASSDAQIIATGTQIESIFSFGPCGGVRTTVDFYPFLRLCRPLARPPGNRRKNILRLQESMRFRSERRLPGGQCERSLVVGPQVGGPGSGQCTIVWSSATVHRLNTVALSARYSYGCYFRILATKLAARAQ